MNSKFKLSLFLSLIALFSFVAIEPLEAKATNPVCKVGPYQSWLNVKTDFGAVGDGVADDTAALQAGLDALRNASDQTGPFVLYLPAGTYRITSTLEVYNDFGISIRGDVDQTTILWDGPQGGHMMRIDGVMVGNIRGIAFDGANLAAIGIDESRGSIGSNSDGPFPNQAWLYEDMRFQNISGDYNSGTGICIRVGHFRVGNDDMGLVRRSKFSNCAIAGIWLQSYNAISWWVEDSQFESGVWAITNSDVGGTWHVRNTVFRNMDHTMKQSGSSGISVRNTFSTGSRFLYWAGQAGFNRRVLFQNNYFTNLNPDTWAGLGLGERGPYLFLDNQINTYTDNPISGNDSYDIEAIRLYTGVAGDGFSLGNTFTVTDPIQYWEPTRVTQIDDQVISPSTFPAITFPDVTARPVEQNCSLIELTDYGTDTNAFQQALAAAVNAGPGAVLHIPAGQYSIDQTLDIPAGSNLTLVGDSEQTKIQWQGPRDQPMIRVHGHGATIKDLLLAGLRPGGANRGQATGIEQVDVNQPNAKVITKRVQMAHMSDYGLLADRTGQALVEYSNSILFNNRVAVGVIGNPQSMNGKVAVFSANTAGNDVDFKLDGPTRFLIEDVYMEDDPKFLEINGDGVTPGEVIVQGATIKILNAENSNGITIDNFPGKVTFLQSQTFNDAGGGFNILQSGAGPVQIFSLGNNYVSDPTFIINANATLMKMHDQVYNGAEYAPVPDVNRPADTVVKDALQTFRNTFPSRDLDPNIVPVTRYENIFMEYWGTAIHLKGGDISSQWFHYLPIILKD